MPKPLRCHLLIGPPASGKTTLAGLLAELTGAVVLSTDVVRGDLFGDAAVQGPWRDIEVLLHQRIREAVASGIPVIVDATHARRPWRLAITQALDLPAPVEWIGWWLYTPLSTCLQWNHTRKRLVPEPVIREMAAALADPVFGPSRAEGMASVVAVVPTHQRELEPLLRDELARLDHRIRSACNRENRFALHGYSRLPGSRAAPLSAAAALQLSRSGGPRSSHPRRA
jgi:predicted kinase